MSAETIAVVNRPQLTLGADSALWVGMILGDLPMVQYENKSAVLPNFALS